MANINPCCCITLRLGSILIGIIEIVWSIVRVCIFILTIAALATVHLQDDKTMQELSDQIKQNHPEIENDEPTVIFGILYFVFGFWCLICILQVIFTSLMIHGIRQERLKLIKAWIVFKSLYLSFSLICFIAVILMQQKRKTYGGIAIGCASMLFGLYFLFVVYRLYNEMWAKSLNQQRPKPNI